MGTVGAAEEYIYNVCHFFTAVDLIAFHQRCQVIQLVGICFAGQDRRPIKFRKSLFNHFGLIGKVQYIHFIFAWAGTVQTGKGLYSRNIVERLVDIHCL